MTAAVTDAERGRRTSAADGAAPRAADRRTRRARRGAVRAFRPRRTLVAAVVGLVVTVVAVLAAVEVIASLSGSAWRLPIGSGAERHVGAARWDDPAVFGASGVLALVGLGLLCLALIPGQGDHRAVRTDDEGFVVGVSEPALRWMLTDAACSVAGVRTAEVRTGAWRIRVRVTADAGAADGAVDAVRTAVRGRVADLVLVHRLRVKVKAKEVHS